MPALKLSFETHASTADMLARYKRARENNRRDPRLEVVPVLPPVEVPPPPPVPIDDPRWPKGAGCDPNVVDIPLFLDIPRKVTVRTIIAQTAAASGVPVDVLISPRRSHQLARWRQISMVLSIRLTVVSMAQIGRIHGGRDHTTVLHAKERWWPQVQVADIDPPSDLESWIATMARLCEAHPLSISNPGIR